MFERAIFCQKKYIYLEIITCFKIVYGEISLMETVFSYHFPVKERLSVHVFLETGNVYSLRSQGINFEIKEIMLRNE